MFTPAFVAITYGLMFGPVSAWAANSGTPAKIAVTAACESQNPRLNLDIDESWWVHHAPRPSASKVPLKLPEDACVRRGQWITLSRKGSAVIWGRAHVIDLQKDPDGFTAMIDLTPAHNDRELRPECESPCEVMWRRLPVGVPGVALIDLREPSAKPRGEVPGAVNIPWTGSLSDFDFQKLPMKPKSIVLFGESPDVQRPPLVELVRELRRRDVSKIYWFYPGYRGVQNLARLFPPAEDSSDFCGDLVLREADHQRLLEPGEVTTLDHPSLANCEAGEVLRLIRYERPADTAFVVGVARILFQTLSSLRIEVEAYDPRETGWIAAIHASAPLRIETPAQIPSHGIRRLRPGELRRHPESDDMNLAMGRETTFLLSSTGLEWRGDLEILDRRRIRGTVPISILAPRPRFPKPHPEGVITVTPAWHEWLMKNRAIAIRPAPIPWTGTAIERPRNLNDRWFETWIRRRALLPMNSAIVVLGDGVGDQGDIQIVRELLLAGYSRVYWDPGTSRPPAWKIRFDPFETSR